MDALAGGPYLLKWDLSTKTLPVLFGEATRVMPGTIFSPSADSVIVPLLGIHLFSVFRGYFATLPTLDLANLPIPLSLGQTAVDTEGRFIAAPGVSRAFSRLVQATCPQTLAPPQFSQCNQELLQRTNLPPMASLLLFRGSDLTFITELEMDEDPHPQFSQNSELLLWRTKNGFHTVDTSCMCNKHDLPMPLPDEGFFDLTFDASASLIATPQAGTNGRIVQLFSLQTNSIVGTLSLGGSRSVRRLAFNSSRTGEGKIVGIGTTSGDVLLWPTNEKTAERIQGSSPVTSLAFSRDGSTLAIGRENGGVSVLSLKTRKLSEIGSAHASSVEAVRFGFGGRWISSLARRGSVLGFRRLVENRHADLTHRGWNSVVAFRQSSGPV